ncbi:MAG: metallophosphoesterase [Candidatus Zixiibacteriota bacterium]|nr:MAG: metallophosphoesterase [candidate division Zixibacteria bacterium]HDL03489.1 metallophosphoesterase [candidate division Zixibacteria bacterium]
MIFFIVVIIILSMMYGYVGWRLIIPARFSIPVNIILWAVLVVALVLPFLPVMMRFRGVGGFWIDALAWIGYLSFGFVTLLFAFLVAKDLILLLSAAVQKSIHYIGGLFGSESVAAETTDPERRRLLVNGLNLGVIGISGAMTGYGMFEAMRKPEIVEVDISIKNLPEEFDGFRIIQITDIHVSHTIKRPFVRAVVDTVNGLNPDLVALTGDLVDGSVDRLHDDVAPLADLEAPHGSFFITGNHEYYSGVQQWVEETARLGFTVLLNEHRIIEKGEGRFLLAGVTDYSGGGFGADHKSDPHKATAGAPDGPVKILLAHQPKSIFEAAEACYDYVISGHTHGGQYFPYHFLTALTQPYLSGLHRHKETQIYVSKGTGYWGPQIRIGARSEITVHRLKSA